MMQQEFLQQPSWPVYTDINHDDHQFGSCDLDFDYDDDPTDFQLMIPFTASDDDLQAMMREFSMEMESVDSVLSDNSEGSSSLSLLSQASSPSPSCKSSEASMESMLTLPGDDLHNRLGFQHLLKAYGEAMEKEQRGLADVIIEYLSSRANPAGDTLERLVFSLSPEFENQRAHLAQESSKNFEAAFKAFYQIFPYGRFAHFAANSAILESLPDAAETAVHIVDFDMGEGIQWPPMIGAMAGQNRTLRLTSMKMEDQDCTCAPRQRCFEQTRKQLCDYARTVGLKLNVDEMGIEDLRWEMKRKKRSGGCRGEWLVFNCAVELPHMGRTRSRKQASDFLQVASEMLSRRSGIVTLGHGEACERLMGSSSGTATTGSGFGSFFQGCLEHYQAVLESMKSSFPTQFAEARMVMESLFVTPYVSSDGWLRKWEETRLGFHLQGGVVGLKECGVSRDGLMEATEMVKRESSYEVRIGGHNGNEMILEFRGSPLVRVSAWRSNDLSK